MDASLPSLLAYGFVLGWSVAWPPGPINAEIARRCLAGGFRAGGGLIVGAAAGDVVWAVLVALGVGVLVQGPGVRLALGVLSIGLLLALAAIFLRAARRALAGAVPPPARFDSARASVLLGLTLALTSPWNVAFWLAAIGRPEMAGHGPAALAVVIAAVTAGAVLWGFLWSAIVLVLRRAATGRAWGVLVNGLTARLMLYFAVGSALRLLAGG